MKELYSFKPKKQAFVWYFIAKSLIFYILGNSVLFIISIVFSDSGFLFFAIISSVFGGIGLISSIINRFFKYKKEKYIFFQDKIVQKTGGLFSDKEIEIQIRNITHISQMIPFIENKLFHTEKINIQTAGTAKAEIVLDSMQMENQAKKKIIKLLEQNNFELGQDNLVGQETPLVSGVIIYLLQGLVSSGFIVLFLILQFSELISNIKNSILSDYFFIIIPLILIIIIIAISLFILFKYFDLKQRKYSIYQGSITYNEGFLTKNYALIPVANLADSSTSQTFLQRLFGIYTIQISTKGIGNDIYFSHMPNGQIMEENIDKVIKEKNFSFKAQNNFNDSKISSENRIPFRKKSIKNYNYEYKDKFQMSIMRSLINPFLGLLLFIVISLIIMSFSQQNLSNALFIIVFIGVIFGIGWFIGTISLLIKIFSTKYFVRENSIRKEFSFLNVQNVEFSLDKITSIEYKKDVLDRIFNTCTVYFYSIGSGQNIEFKNIKDYKGLVKKMISKTDIEINNDKKLYDLKAKFTLFSIICANLIKLIVIFFIIGGFLFGLLFIQDKSIYYLFIIVLCIIGIILGLILIYKYFFYRQAKISIYSKFIEYKGGIFIWRQKYAHFDFIKTLSTTKYPFIDVGEMKFDISGETVIKNNKNNNNSKLININSQASQQNQSLKSNIISLSYVTEIHKQDELIDQIILNRPTKMYFSKEKVLDQIKVNILNSAKPVIWNNLPGLVIFSLIFPPILILSIIRIMQILAMKYCLEDYRIVYYSGIIYKSQTSILYKNIDHIDKSQGFLNKLFSNGNIAINTEGSSGIEMMISNISNWKEFYTDIQKKYSKNY